MVPPNLIPVVVIVGTLLVAIAAPVFLGADLWFVPLVLLPFIVLYVLADRRLAKQEEEGGGSH